MNIFFFLVNFSKLSQSYIFFKYVDIDLFHEMHYFHNVMIKHIFKYIKYIYLNYQII